MNEKKWNNLSRHEFVKGMSEGLRHRCGVKSGDALLVAVSGGADSVALLRGMRLLSEKRGWRMRLVVGHVQHHLRGDDAEGDARFVKEVCEELGVEYVRADLDLSEAKNVEGDARVERYRVLVEMAEREGCGVIVTAHHADDQLETMLMRMLRGSGVKGMRGIAWKRKMYGTDVKLIRPMLGIDKKVAVDFLEEIRKVKGEMGGGDAANGSGQTSGGGWREDHTNMDVTRLRARLRHEVLPILKDIREDAGVKAVQLADHMRELDGWLKEELVKAREVFVKPMDNGYSLDRGAARMVNKLIVSTLIRDLVRELGVDTDRSGERELGPIVKAVRDKSGEERVFGLNGGVEVRVGKIEVFIYGRD